MSISSSFRLFPPNFIIKTYFNSPSKTLISISPDKASKFNPFSSISIQRIPTSLPQSSSQSLSLQQTIEDLPPNLQVIINLFQSVDKPKAKFEQLIDYGKTLPPLDSKFKTLENKVSGCVSQVWVRAYFDSERSLEKRVLFEADSDSVFTKGLAALLVKGLSGQPVAEILRVSPQFIPLLGLNNQSLSASRNNGFLNMLRLMQKKALQLEMGVEVEMESESLGLSSGSENGGGNLMHEVKDEVGVEEESETDEEEVVAILGSRGERIKDILERGLNPVELEVEDISYQHAGHAGVRGSEGETHFNVRVVSEEFEGKSMVKRHRVIYSLLQEELQSGLHALSIVAKTPSEVISK
ncbi:hypothetical protein GIB67_001074 [Kingdonia uniflora]|uniref:Fe-S metabolism associated domain-containing protein n=1 Tax=Kingdonia uniflora TaxID=39325 RepID=A0A7J7MG39_9MAGN|nr:hypothetical protein GIB67_001074 [Kingdonia uniflora]